jgi:hypothetical protein
VIETHGRKFHIRREGVFWALYHPAGTWELCVTFSEAIIKLNRDINYMKYRGWS